MVSKNSKIFIAGHKGMVGSAVWNTLQDNGYTNLIGKSSSELDLRNQVDVESFFIAEKPTVVIDTAAKVGGIMAKTTLLNLPWPTGVRNLYFWAVPVSIRNLPHNLFRNHRCLLCL
jgi:nucleoside-diphosphate-sugar epimerase